MSDEQALLDATYDSSGLTEATFAGITIRHTPLVVAAAKRVVYLAFSIGALVTVDIVLDIVLGDNWWPLVGLVFPVLFVWCGYVGVKNRTETLVQSFNFCAFCCAVVAAVGVALTWEELQNSRDYCSGKIHHDQETNQVFEGECDGKHVRQSLVTNAALSTTLLVIIGVLECAAGWFSWTLLKDGKTLFVQPYAPGQVVVGQPVYVPAQSFASSTQPAAFQSPVSVDP